MATFKCFWIEPTGEAHSTTTVRCGVCDRVNDVANGTVKTDQRREWEDMEWATSCAGCGREFDPENDPKDHRHSSANTLYRDAEGKVATLKAFAPGAMYDVAADHVPEGWVGPDGRSIGVRMPGAYVHTWYVDSDASNCDQKDRPHKCWVRTGEPPNLTVGKGQPGESCTAGAGSIWVDMPNGWHGFLTRGYLVECGDPDPPA